MTSVPKWQSKFLIKVSIMYKKGSVMKIKDKTTQKKLLLDHFRVMTQIYMANMRVIHTKNVTHSLKRFLK